MLRRISYFTCFLFLATYCYGTSLRIDLGHEITIAAEVGKQAGIEVVSNQHNINDLVAKKYVSQLRNLQLTNLTIEWTKPKILRFGTNLTINEKIVNEKTLTALLNEMGQDNPSVKTLKIENDVGPVFPGFNISLLFERFPEINTFSTHTSIHDFEPFKKLKELKCLKINAFEMERIADSPIFSHIEELEFYDFVNDGDWKDLLKNFSKSQHLKNLRTLKFGGTILSADQISSLQKNPNFKHVTIFCGSRRGPNDAEYPPVA